MLVILRYSSVSVSPPFVETTENNAICCFSKIDCVDGSAIGEIGAERGARHGRIAREELTCCLSQSHVRFCATLNESLGPFVRSDGKLVLQGVICEVRCACSHWMVKLIDWRICHGTSMNHTVDLLEPRR